MRGLPSALRTVFRSTGPALSLSFSATPTTAALPPSSFRPDEMVETRRGARERELPHLSLEQAVQNIRRCMHLAPLCPPVSHKHAAVLVPLFELHGDIHVILTQRSPRMRKHAGEVCFPGGKREAGDADDVATALREAHEELGIPPIAVNVVSTLAPVLSKHLLSVTPVIATVPADLDFSPDPSEVGAVFSAPLRMFLEAGPGYRHMDVEWEGCPYRLHYFDYVYRGQQYLIWGLTAGMLVVVAEKALGRPAQFELQPPGAMPYTALAFERGRIVFRSPSALTATGGSGSAAVSGAVGVTDAEAEAAVGGTL